MPLATINVLSGHDKSVLQAMLQEFSSTYARILSAPMDRLQIWINEIDPALYAISGVPADQALSEGCREDLEIPLIQLALMEGRPQEQVNAAIAELSALVARHLGGAPERVRVEVRPVAPERWGIGGLPASEVRRAELEGRRAAG